MKQCLKQQKRLSQNLVSKLPPSPNVCTESKVGASFENNPV